MMLLVLGVGGLLLASACLLFDLGLFGGWWYCLLLVGLVVCFDLLIYIGLC